MSRSSKSTDRVGSAPFRGAGLHQNAQPEADFRGSLRPRVSGVQFRCQRAVRLALALTVAVGTLSACAAGDPTISGVRPLVVTSGARIQPDSTLLDSINRWVPRMQQFIQEDPSFMVLTETVPRAAYPWETLEIRGEDTVRVAHEAVPDPGLAYQIYGFLHLMKKMGRIGEWFPEAESLEGYQLERFILDRTVDTWLLGRAVYDTQPYAPLDELVFARDRGFLDEMILTARPDEFPDEYAAFEEEHPGRLEAFREWFRETFDKDPPGPAKG